MNAIVVEREGGMPEAGQSSKKENAPKHVHVHVLVLVLVRGKPIKVTVLRRRAHE